MPELSTIFLVFGAMVFGFFFWFLVPGKRMVRKRRLSVICVYENKLSNSLKFKILVPLNSFNTNKSSSPVIR